MKKCEKLAMYQPDYELPSIQIESDHRSDGSIILRNTVPLPPLEENLFQKLAHWATEQPDKIFLSQGERVVSYADTLATSRYIAARLLLLPVSSDRPLMIIGGNGINHALFMLAASSVGIPAAIVAPTYCLPEGAPWTNLTNLSTCVDPGLIVAESPENVSIALKAHLPPDVSIRPLNELVWLDTLDSVTDCSLNRAESNVTPDTVTKLLFTSGSTGTPKAVMNTQRMMVSAMQSIGLSLPFLHDRPPVLVDWLPWSHTFGGNHCFNQALWFGGTFHIDEGKPVPALIDRTIEAIRTHKPTIYFNVPAGFDALLPTLESDDDFAGDFLGNLDFIFSGGAPMPAGMQARIEAVALRATGRKLNIFGGWGSTETAPCSTLLHFPTDHTGNLGVPLPGVEVKLTPDSDRMELRVRGPNVMPGYWRQPALTGAAFDDEGFYLIGDAGRMVDVDDPSAGIIFDGRVAENFKLLSGTWVNVGKLRLAIIAVGERLISDVVITGEGKSELGALIFLSLEAQTQESAPNAGGGQALESVHTRISRLLRTYNDLQVGGSTRIGHFLIMTEPPSSTQGEITEKGYINQRRVLARRADLIDELYDSELLSQVNINGTARN